MTMVTEHINEQRTGEHVEFYQTDHLPLSPPPKKKKNTTAASSTFSLAYFVLFFLFFLVLVHFYLSAIKLHYLSRASTRYSDQP